VQRAGLATQLSSASPSAHIHVSATAASASATRHWLVATGAQVSVITEDVSQEPVEVL